MIRSVGRKAESEKGVLEIRAGKIGRPVLFARDKFCSSWPHLYFLAEQGNTQKQR